jgi:hypothetical protein
MTASGIDLREGIMEITNGDTLRIDFLDEESKHWRMNGKEFCHFTGIAYVALLTPSAYRDLTCMPWLFRVLKRWIRIIHRRLARKTKEVET